MSINFQAFLDNCYYMGVGLAGIFIVIGVIMAVTLILNRIFK